jgi:hypothetical protein
MKPNNRRLIPFIIVLIFAIIACGPGGTATLATPDLLTLQTYAAQTIAAIQAGLGSTTTPVPLVQPSDTPSGATLAPSLIPSTTATTGSVIPCDSAAFVSETIPDGTNFTPTAAFIKTWRVRNVGTCTWNGSYAIVFDHGVKLGASDAVPFPGTVAPGQEVDLSLSMAAPAAEGTYESYWKFRNSSGIIFITYPFSVKINVIIPTPTKTATLPPPMIMPYTQQVVKQVSIAAGANGSSTIACPASSVVTGGGFALNNNMIAYTHSQDGNAWTTYAKNNGASSGLLNSYAVCLFASMGTTSMVWNQVTISAGTNGNAFVACPAGSVVTGGGYASNTNLFVYNSSMSSNGWQVYAQNTSGSSQLLNSYATCLAGTTGSTSQVLAQKSIPSGASDGAEASCPAGTILTGGGFAGSTNIWVYNISMKTMDSETWNVFGKNLTGTSQLLNSYAICLHP